MDHLAEIDDVAVHDAIELFETQMELLVLSLLDADHATATMQITTARDGAADRIINLAKDCAPTNGDAKVIRIAAAMLPWRSRSLREDANAYWRSPELQQQHRDAIARAEGGAPPAAPPGNSGSAAAPGPPDGSMFRN